MSGQGPLTPDLPRSALDRLSPGGEGGVGYCRPPRAARFRPGQSGNPRGRPKRARGALIAQALDEKVEAKENGKRRRITKLEAVVTQLVNRAANGDQRANAIRLRSPARRSGLLGAARG